MAVAYLQVLGARLIPANPMLNYCLHMAGGAFTGIGVFFLALSVKPERFPFIVVITGMRYSAQLPAKT